MDIQVRKKIFAGGPARARPLSPDPGSASDYHKVFIPLDHGPQQFPSYGLIANGFTSPEFDPFLILITFYLVPFYMTVHYGFGED
jgi:hypothetical protein